MREVEGYAGAGIGFCVAFERYARARTGLGIVFERCMSVEMVVIAGV